MVKKIEVMTPEEEDKNAGVVRDSDGNVMSEVTSTSKELKLIPPTDPRVQSAIAPFQDDMLKEHNFKDRKRKSKGCHIKSRYERLSDWTS